jgi:hypothetical protein
MQMKQFYSYLIVLFVFFNVQLTMAQELYVGSGAEFYLKKDLFFTTNNTVVSVDALGKFSLEAGNNWGSEFEFVNGDVNAYGNGLTKLPTGNNSIYAPVIADHTGDIFASYFNAMPNSGANGTDVIAVSDIEYWELTGNAIITLPWNSASDITNLVNSNGGKLSSVAIVGYDSGVWNLVSAPQTNIVTGDLVNGTVTSDASNEVVLDNFGQFTFGIDNQVVLGLDDLFITNDINIISNPIDSGAREIQFTSNNVDDLQITLYDFLGRKIKFYEEIIIQNGRGKILKPNLHSGIYLLKFEQEGKQGVKKIIVK